jgi:hypothetical protein
MRFIAIALVLVASMPARAQSDADRATARALGEQAHTALTAKDYATAADLFARAEALVAAPTLTLGLARAQAGLGKLVAAHESYQRVVRWDLGPRAPRAFAAAVEAARMEIASVARRLPSLVITVENRTAASVTVDGQPVPKAALGVPRFVDPGKHTVAASGEGSVPATVEIEVAEGESKPVTLRLEQTRIATAVAGATPVARARSSAGAAVGGEVIVMRPIDGRAPGSAAANISPALVGVGVAGLVGGVATGAIALSQRPHGVATEAETASYHRMRDLAIGSLVGGGAALLGGTLLGLAAGDTAIGQRRRLELGLVGVGLAGVAVGTVSGVMNRSVHGHLETACPDRVCPDPERPNTRSLRQLGIMSISSFAIGAASLGIGTVLFLSEDSGERQGSPKIALQMSPNRLVLEGTW